MVKEIHDVEFQRALYESVNRIDSPRRFEVHFTDLMWSLILSFYRKLFPSEYTEEDYSTLMTWMRGKGHEIGSINMLSLHNPKSQKITRCGKAMGSLDLILNGTIYELTTTIAFPKGRKLPYLSKAKQLMWYISSEDKPMGKVKIHSLLTRNSRTWVFRLNKKRRARIRHRIRLRGFLLFKALELGNWKLLPRTNCSFLQDEEEDTIAWMEENEKEVGRAHKDWLEDREKYYKPQSLPVQA
jgi:hypothetical protein